MILENAGQRKLLVFRFCDDNKLTGGELFEFGKERQGDKLDKLFLRFGELHILAAIRQDWVAEFRFHLALDTKKKKLLFFELLNHEIL